MYRLLRKIMSRIGKKPISIPAGVTVSVDAGNLVKVKGPKGELTLQVDSELTVEIEDGQVSVKRPTDQKRHRAFHGLFRSLIANQIIGVSEGFSKEMELVGVGYKAEAKGQVLDLSLGYSHGLMVVIPPEIKIETDTQKGKTPKIKISGIDKHLLGHVAAKIRSLRPPEPYKGKGIRFVGEIIRRKAGKAAAKS